MGRWTFPALAGALLLGFGCEAPDQAPAEPVTQDEPRPFVEGRGGVGWACPAGPVDCAYGLGCVDGVCSTDCDDGEDCDAAEGCVDGACGACTGDLECAVGEGCVDGFCLQDEIPSWDVSVNPDYLDAMADEPWSDLAAPVTLTVGDDVYEGGAMRLYGGSSRAWPKKSFRITFPEDADHPGFSRKVTLRAEYNDASFLRTWLGYHAFERSTLLPRPRTRFVRLEINGEYYGLMQEVERIGGRFLEHNGRDRDRSLYEVQQDWPTGALTPLPDEDAWRFVYNKKTGDPDDYSDLETLVEDALWPDYLASAALNETSTERTRAHVDLDQYVDYLAVMTAIGNKDHITNNFYLSRQHLPGIGERWQVYPYDLDLTFGCSWSAEDSTLCTSFEWDEWWLNGTILDGETETCWCNLGIHLTLWDEVFGAAYLDRICELTDEPLFRGDGARLVSAMSEVLADAVGEDPNDRNETAADWLRATQEVADYFTLRRSWLQSELGCP